MTPAKTGRSGFVSLVGRPNTGKSTLLNALVNMRLAAVADKPQTTRTSIQGVLTLPEAQIIFLDTPGIHESGSMLDRRMMETVRGALADRDLVLLVADADAGFLDEDSRAAEMVRAQPAPVLAVLNKIDQVKDKRLLLPLMERFSAAAGAASCFPVSALTGEGLDLLRREIVARLPEGPQYYPPDHVTDQPERFLAVELIREKILRFTHHEVPHAVAVLLDRWDETPQLLRLAATIYVERDGQKGILIGAKGAALKRIGTEARLALESTLGRKIFLQLFVKVKPRWRDDAAFLNELDWRSMAGVQ